jgi:hypothetical protein
LSGHECLQNLWVVTPCDASAVGSVTETGCHRVTEGTEPRSKMEGSRLERKKVRPLAAYRIECRSAEKLAKVPPSRRGVRAQKAPCAARRVQDTRKKKPGRFGRDEKLVSARKGVSEGSFASPACCGQAQDDGGPTGRVARASTLRAEMPSER